MENNSFEEIYEKLKNSKKVLLSLHKGPDGDSLGSCTTMKYFLERDFGCEVKIISKDNLDEVFGNLEISKDIEFGIDINKIDFSEYDVFVVLDSGSLDMLDFNKENKEKIFIINFDHHATNPFYGNLNCVFPESNSCASILIKFFKETDVEFDSELATKLLLGVCSDSGYFTNSNSEDALVDTAFLIGKGGKYIDFILKEVVFKQPLRIKKYAAYVVDNLILDENKKFGYSLLSYEKVKEFDLNLSEIRLGISFIQNLEGLDVTFTIAEIGNGTYKISFRSQGKVDISEFAHQLGGGGHKNAAGAEIKADNLDEAKKKVLEVVENKL